MFLKEYRYMLDGEEAILYAVLKYGGMESNANTVQVFMKQDFVQIAKPFNHNDFGYQKVEEKNGGYYINSTMDGGMGTVEFLDEFMDNYASALYADEVRKVVCSCCEKTKFDVLSDNVAIWCKVKSDMAYVKTIKLR